MTTRSLIRFCPLLAAIACAMPAFAEPPAADAASAPVQRVEVNSPRTPSFHARERGAEITEYRRPGKAADVEVKTDLGTRYTLPNPNGAAPPIPDGQMQRLPSVNVLKF